MREIKRAEHLIEAARQRARGPLHVQAQTSVTHLMGSRPR